MKESSKIFEPLAGVSLHFMSENWKLLLARGKFRKSKVLDFAGKWSFFYFSSQSLRESISRKNLREYYLEISVNLY